MKFEFAKDVDLPRIVEIYNENISSRMVTADLKPVTVSERINWFEQFNNQYPIWIIKIKQTIVGWVSLEPFYGRAAYRGTAEISIYVDKKVQRHGIGQAALNYVFSILTDLDHDTLLAFIFSCNKASQNLFKKNNFKRWGHCLILLIWVIIDVV